MIKNYTWLLGILILVASCTSCSEDDRNNYVAIQSGLEVSLNLDKIPYKSLSEYNFFEGDMTKLQPSNRVLPYQIISGLFIDYAQAKTFVWMPKGQKAKYVDDYSIFDFPEGTVLITTHYFTNTLPSKLDQMIETRLLIKKKEGWVLANYKWSDDQSDAYYTTESSTIRVKILDQDKTRAINYRIPSYDECFTCHNKYDEILPIGPKPQNINKDFAFKDGSKNQLSKWVEAGYLENTLPEHIETVVNWQDDSQPLHMRVRSYLDINCAHCHTDKGYCEYAPLRFAFNQTEDIKNMGVDVKHSFNLEEGQTHIVSPGKPEESAMFFRISSTLDEYKMPIIGRNLQHEEGAKLIKEWITSLEDNL